MAHFVSTSPLSIGKKGQWCLFGPWIYQSDALGPAIRIPEGFETDLASIPRVFTPLIAKNGRHRKAAIVHDYLYSVKGELAKGVVLTRKECDQIFHEAMKHCGVSGWKRWAMYSAVRTGGWIYWSREDD